MLTDYSQRGSFSFATYRYASGLPRSGQTYGASIDYKDYAIYDSPKPEFTSPRIDLRGFVYLPFGDWPFQADEVPLNGELFVPSSGGPLVVIAHGNHRKVVNSST